jgi:hypothetical protein
MANTLDTLDPISERGAGKAAAVRARANGLTGVFNQLAQEHAEAASLLQHAKAADDPEKREALWNEVRSEILAHERAEFAILYPILDETPETTAIPRLHARGAQLLETAIAAIDALGYDSAEWEASLENLISIVEAHVHEEETEFFPRALRQLGKKAAIALEPTFKVAKERFKEETRWGMSSH